MYKFYFIDYIHHMKCHHLLDTVCSNICFQKCTYEHPGYKTNHNILSLHTECNLLVEVFEYFPLNDISNSWPFATSGVYGQQCYK